MLYSVSGCCKQAIGSFGKPVVLRLSIGLGGILLFTPYAAWALFGDSVRPSASYSVSHDSNFFRVANADQAQALLGTTNTAATSRNVTVGVDADLRVSRQTILLRSNLNQTSFDRTELQTQNGRLLSADWQWVFGNRLNGNLSYLTSRDLQAQTDTLSAQASTQDRNDINFTANYQVHPSFSVLIGAKKSIAEFSPTDREILNREENTQNLGLRYTSGVGNQIGLQFQRLDGRYVNRPAPTDRYEQSEISLQGDWRLGGHTLLRAQLGNTRRSENQITQQTPSWRLAVDWTPSGKTTLNAFVARQITSSDSLTTANSSVTRTQGLSGNLQLSAKTRLNASLTAETRDFSGITRRDETQTANLGLQYQPLRNLSVGMNYQIGRRDSNLDNTDFRYRQFTVNLRAAF